MVNIADPARYQEIISRIERLEPNAKPLWGKMNTAEMFAHMTAACEMALGRLPVKMQGNRASQAFATFVFLDILPFFRNLPTAPELVSPPATIEEFTANKAAFLAVLQEFVAAMPNGPWGPHPIFGKLSGPKYGKLFYKHTAHHLRQFGV